MCESGIRCCFNNWAASKLSDKTNKMTVRPAKTQIRVFAVRSMSSLRPKLYSCGQRRLIRLGGCPGWSESSLGAHAILFVLPWGGIYSFECLVASMMVVSCKKAQTHLLRYLGYDILIWKPIVGKTPRLWRQSFTFWGAYQTLSREYLNKASLRRFQCVLY